MCANIRSWWLTEELITVSTAAINFWTSGSIVIHMQLFYTFKMVVGRKEKITRRKINERIIPDNFCREQRRINRHTRIRSQSPNFWSFSKFLTWNPLEGHNNNWWWPSSHNIQSFHRNMPTCCFLRTRQYHSSNRHLSQRCSN